MAGASFRGLGPELERLAFAIGIKPALRIQVPAAQAEAAARRWRAKGLHAEAAGELIYVAREAARVEALREVEAPIRPGGPRLTPDTSVLAAHREVGRLLGYPGCCVAAFLERVERGVTVRRVGTEASERFVAAEDALLRSERLHARLNFLLPRREALVPFDPCRFDCEPALAYATALLEAREARRPEAAAALRERLVTVVELEPGLRLDFEAL